VAHVVKASLSSVKRWKQAVAQGGTAALAAKPHPGAKPKLTPSQKRRLVAIRPTAAGYRTELWTCARVAEVVGRRFGVSYHPDHLGRVLRALGFSPQKPESRARERDEAAIRRWRAHDWPRIKKRGVGEKLASCSSTRAVSGWSR